MHIKDSKQLLLALSVILLSLLLLFKVHPTMAGDNNWTPIGLYGAGVEALAIDPNNASIIYAGTTGAGLFKSIDEGDTWTLISQGITEMNEISDIAVDPNNSDTIYVAPHWMPLHKSIDGGATWIALINSSSFVVAVSPIDSNLVLSGNGTIWRSTDAGDSWETTEGAPRDVRVIAFAPSAPHIVYAGSFLGVWKSSNSGLTWAPIHNGFVEPPMVYSLAIDPFDSQGVYIGTGMDGIYKTTNGGVSWTPIGSGLGSNHISSIAINPGNQQVIYVGGGINPSSGTPGVYRSLDNLGLSWGPIMEGMGSRAIYRLAIDDSTPRNIYAAVYGGLWKYTEISGPEDLSISINDGALFTNLTDVTLTISAPIGTNEMMISNDGGFGGASWEPYANIKPWSITAYGSFVIPRTVYAKFRTNGQISGVYQDDIILDQNPPTGTVEIIEPSTSTTTSVPLVTGYSPATFSSTQYHAVFLPFGYKSYQPGLRMIGLSLSAADDVSGVDSVLISNEAAFSDAEWQAYVQKTNWYVSENGTTIVYIKYRDRAGNVSQIYSDVTIAP